MSTGVDLKHIMLSEKKPYVKSLQSTLWYSHNILEWAKLMEKYQKVYCLWWDEVELTEKSHGAAFWNDFVVQSLSCVQVFATPWTTACQASLSFTNSQSFLKLMSIELVMLSNHLFLCCLLLFLPSFFPSIRVFSNESPLYIWWRGGQSIGTSASASVLSVNIHRYTMNIQWTIQFSSVAQSFPTLCDPWIAARQASLSITNSRSTPP